MIHVYNTYLEDYTFSPNNIPIYDGTIFENPFKCNGKRNRKNKLTFKTNEDALAAYRIYFHEMYENNDEFRKAFDNIFEKYKNGEDIYLQCFCKPNSCHGDILAEELQKKLVLEYKKQAK